MGYIGLWKKDLIKNIELIEPSIILDLAGGTGDISQLLLKKFNKSKIIIYDLSYEMIKKSKTKFNSKILYIYKWFSRIYLFTR